jgi:hypothetical protein
MKLTRFLVLASLGLFAALVPLAAAPEALVTITQDGGSLDLVPQEGHLILTLDSNVMRPEYTRYWFDPQEWKTKVGPNANLMGTLKLELAVNPRPAGPPQSAGGGAQPQGGIRYRDFDARILKVVSRPTAGTPSEAPEGADVYQGSLTTPSGPGMDVVLSLRPDGESELRYTFLKGPVDWTTELGTWTDDGRLVQVTPADEDGLPLRLVRQGSRLRSADADGRPLGPDTAPWFLLKVSP